MSFKSISRLYLIFLSFTTIGCGKSVLWYESFRQLPPAEFKSSDKNDNKDDLDKKSDSSSDEPGVSGPTKDSGSVNPKPNPQPTPNREFLGKFFTTFYYVIDEKAYQGPAEETLLDKEGIVLSTVSKKFKKDLLMEGTGWLKDGRTVNVGAKVEDKFRFRISSSKWGWGVGACPLRPYRTIAVDPTQIPLGSVVYIPKADGMKLPGGLVHDGLFYAEDIGGWIKNRHIDFFSALGMSSSAPYEAAGIISGKYVEAYLQHRPIQNGCTLMPPFDSDH